MCLLAIGACARDEGPATSPPLPPPSPAPRPGFYVAPPPYGRPTSDGSAEHPWDLATALSGASGRVLPGDTIWLRGGTYRGAFVSAVQGAAGLPVVVRQWPGERAIIDGAGTPSTVSTLFVSGAWTEFRDFELTNSSRDRASPRPDVIANYASHTRYRALVIHDGGVAFFSEHSTADVDIGECIIYNNGWDAADRGHGHGVYVKSDVGPVSVHDNVIFNQFGYGIHAYSNRGSGGLVGMRFERNVVFDNGAVSRDPARSGNVLVGGAEPADDGTVTGNVAYDAAGVPAPNVQLGFDTVLNGRAALSGNYLVGGTTVLDVGFWSAAAVTDNDLTGDGIVQAIRNPITLGASWSGNRNHRDPSDSAWEFAGLELPFDAWQLVSGLAVTDVADDQPPPMARVFVLADSAEPGRAIVAVFNWLGEGAVAVNLGRVLSPGDRYDIRNVQALFDPPAASGDYDGGTIALPLTGVAPPVPTGLAASPAPQTGPFFDVFIVTRR